jgi:hypothetical protein
VRLSAHVLPIVVGAVSVPVPEVRAELIRIDVVVADAAGKTVRGLAREDFEGTEDGRPQWIAAAVPAPDPTERGQGLRRRTV